MCRAFRIAAEDQFSMQYRRDYENAVIGRNNKKGAGDCMLDAGIYEQLSRLQIAMKQAARIWQETADPCRKRDFCGIFHSGVYAGR